MATIPTIQELKRALHIQENIEALQRELGSLFGQQIPKAARSGRDSVLGLVGVGGKRRKKNRMSAAGRARIAAAQKLRWSKVKGQAKAAKPAKKKRTITA